MAIPINVEDLLNKRKIESNRIEFKASWNPDKIYHTICAFANDFENIGGGYIIVGVEEENGIAKRPVKGIEENCVDKILRNMVAYDAKISPHYMPKVSPETIDGKTILVIWAPAGVNRPYSVTESVVANKSVPKWYVRSKSSTIEAKGEILDELRNLAHRIPFDDRGNESISIDDISALRVLEYLKTINSKLVNEFPKRQLWEILDEMDLLIGPTENRLIKNCAAMMFCDNPAKFFPTTQVEIVLFPQGSIDNPDIMIEVPPIIGPVPVMIKETLSYLKTNLIKKKISKLADTEKSDKAYNYPYQALEEAIVNALYHRDYQEREPVEITIEPTHIDILSYAGPDRSISDEAIKAAKRLKARRYRNRRLGDFLKELDLTEGRATGIPTIQKALKDNGSPHAIIDTNEQRTYFLITIPCREDMVEHAIDQIKEMSIEDQELIKAVLQVFLQVESVDNQYTKKEKEAIAYKVLQVVLQVFLQVWEPVDLNYNDMGRILMQTLLVLKDSEVQASKLLHLTGLDSLYKYKRYILNVLIKHKYIEMTMPDKPTSSKQGYRLTQKGYDLLSV